MIRELSPQKAKGGKNALQCVGFRDESPMLADAESSEAKTSRGYASGQIRAIIPDIASVFHHARLGAALFPEKLKICSL